MQRLLKMLSRKAMEARVWQCLTLLAIIWGIWHGGEVHKIDMQDTRFSLIDGTGTYFIGRMGTLETEEKYKRHAIRDIIDAMFHRGPITKDSPYGLYAPERFERVFNIE